MTMHQGVWKKKVSVLYKRKPCEVNVGPYNTVILKLLKSNLNLQFVTGVYALLTCLTSYLCKPEYAVSERMKKTSKELMEKILNVKCFVLVIHFCLNVRFLHMKQSKEYYLYLRGIQI